MDLLGKIMAQLLSILTLLTKMIAKRTMGELICYLFCPLVDCGSVKFLKRFMGRTSTEDVLLQLDRLTQEECLMMATNTLEVTQYVTNVVCDVDGGVKATNSLVEAIDENGKATKVLTKDIDANVTKVTKALTEEVSDSVKGVGQVACSMADNMRDNTHCA